MISILGYNFCSDANALDPFPTNITNITNITIKNGIFDHFNLTKDVTSSMSTVIPTDWDINTIINANFNNSISGGNVEEIAKDIIEVKVKRRLKGTFNWTTIKIVPITQPEDLSFVFTDNLAANNTEYEYAWVPVMGSTNNPVEGNYIIDSIVSQFNGVFICDINTIYKFFAGVEYGTQDAVQQIGIFQPFGRQYPVIVSNGLINYKTGNIKGTVLPQNYENTGVLDRADMISQREILVQLLTNKKPKIIKDWNGNIWLCFITGNPQITFDNNWGMGLATVSADWTEIGNAQSNQDLYECGMIPTED